MRLVGHVARSQGGRKGAVRQTLCGRTKTIWPDGGFLFGCPTCLSVLLAIANTQSRDLERTYTATVEFRRTDES